MKRYALHIGIVLLCILQILSLIKIIKLEKDFENIGSYLSRKIDNVTSKVNMLPEKLNNLDNITESNDTK